MCRQRAAESVSSPSVPAPFTTAAAEAAATAAAEAAAAANAAAKGSRPGPWRLAWLAALAALATGLPLAAPPALARKPDPIPPPAPEISDAVALARVPGDLLASPGLQIVLDRRHRQLMVLENGELKRRFPAAVGTVGWETPAGRHQVL